MSITADQRKALIDSLTKHYYDSFEREFKWGSPDKAYLDSLTEDFIVALIQANEWIDTAKRNGWKTVQSEAENLKRSVESALKFADQGGDPLYNGQWIVNLLRLIPGDITKQKLGISSWKEMRKLNLDS